MMSGRWVGQESPEDALMRSALRLVFARTAVRATIKRRDACQLECLCATDGPDTSHVAGLCRFAKQGVERNDCLHGDLWRICSPRHEVHHRVPASLIDSPVIVWGGTVGQRVHGVAQLSSLDSRQFRCELCDAIR